MQQEIIEKISSDLSLWKEQANGITPIGTETVYTRIKQHTRAHRLSWNDFSQWYEARRIKFI